MNFRIKANSYTSKLGRFLTPVSIVAGFLFCVVGARAQTPESDPTNIALQSWSFSDPTYWTDDAGYAPISFTNIASSQLGYGQTLVVDTNIPAWLKYNVVESDRTTNLTLNSGTVMFWFAAGSWSSTNAGGTGPGEYGRLLEVGNYTANSSYGLWSIYVDSGGNNLYFSAQTNDLSSNLTTYVCAPISWTTNDFHFVALTYSATNTTLYLDGVQATNGPGVTVYPGQNVLTNGFCIGSDTNGIYQAHGLFDLVQTYNYPLDSNDVQTIFAWYHWDFIIDPNNAEYMDSGVTDPFSLSTTTNLAISPLTFSNNTASLFVVNSSPDILYEVQGCTNLALRNWFTEGFVVGSELTNWTWANFYVSKKGDLFLRIRNWQDATGTGIPDWWWFQYFGQDTNVNPYADPTGDGWTVAQDFESGWNPNIFRTPSGPQGVTVTYNNATGVATISWLPSPGSVTGYIITTSTGGSYTVSASTTSYPVTVSYSPNFSYYSDGDPTLDESFQVQAEYALGNSFPSATVWLQPTTVFGDIIPGPSGGNVLAVANIPADAAKVRVFMFFTGTYDEDNYTFTIQTNVDIPVADFVNGFAPAYSSWLNWPSFPVNVTYVQHYFYLQSVDTNGNASGGSRLIENWGPGNFYDGREQLKQNLTFQFRVADTISQFGFISFTNVVDYGPYVFANVSNPQSYVYASFYDDDDYNAMYGTVEDQPTINIYRPFQDNMLYRNFVYTPSDVDDNGLMTTGVQLDSQLDDGTNLDLEFVPTYLPATNEVSDPLLGSAQYLCTYSYSASGHSDTPFATVGISWPSDANFDLYFSNNIVNYWGLTFSNAEVYYIDFNTGDTNHTVLNAGSSLASVGGPSSIYMNTTLPRYRTVEYEFWNDNNYFPQFYSPTYFGFGPSSSGTTNLPGNSAFATTNTGQLLIVGVGQNIGIAAFEKLEVTNSAYTGVYGYVQQYLTNAYQIGTNGNVTTNLTGIVSPYGNYFATQAGAAEVVTMPDPDTGQQGTDEVYAVSLNVDKNHDGTMDLSWNGPDTTSQSSPMKFWINDDDDGTGIGQDIDTPLYPDSTNNFIQSMRDLEDFARLWICGMPSVDSLNGYQVSLSWTNISSGNPVIRLFLSQDPNGSDSYLTHTNAAAAYVQNTLNASSFGMVSNGASFIFPDLFFENTGTKHFIFEGASTGEGELVLTVTDSNSNTLAQTGVWLDLHEITDFYEYACATNVTSSPPPSSLVSQLQVVRTIPALPNESKQVIVFVHGINNTDFDAQNTAETIYKRLYWSGYHGRVAAFRWPCGLLPTENTWYPFEYNESEFWAYKSATAFKAYLNYLKNRPDLAGYDIDILAHSQGNAVASEALSEGAPFNNYILSQGAVPAECYDGSTPTLSALVVADETTPTPFYATVGGYYEYWTNISGNLIDFYNTNDFALATGTTLGLPTNWEENQKTQKPEAFAGGPSYIFYPSSQTSIAYFTLGGDYTVTDWQESRSMVARSRTSAVGAQGGLNGVIGSSVDLVGQFGFGNSRPEHSAEFTRPIQTTWEYYNEVLTSFGIQPTLQQ